MFKNMSFIVIDGIFKPKKVSTAKFKGVIRCLHSIF